AVSGSTRTIRCTATSSRPSTTSSCSAPPPTSCARSDANSPTSRPDRMTALTVTELLERLADVDDRGLRFEETELSWREHVAQSRRRAALLRDLLDGPAPKHIGILMDNVPEFSLLLGAAAFSGSVVVGLNTTRRGAAPCG